MLNKIKGVLLVLLPVILLMGLHTDVRAATYHLSLPHPITDGSLEKHVDTLAKATSKDTVIISTDSGGGSLLEMHRLVIALKTSRATSYCHITNFAASAAAIITIACDSFGMDKHAKILFHMPSRYYSVGGYDLFSDCITVDDICPAYRKKAQMFSNYMRALGAKQMMTSEQWDKMIHGTDIILTRDDVIKNLKARR